MKIDELFPIPTMKASFKLASFKLIPKKSGCYVLTTFEKDILYIGRSKNLYCRFQQHLDNPEKTDKTPEGRVFWFYFLLYDEENLPRLERTWLNKFNTSNGKNPILNKISSSIL